MQCAWGDRDWTSASECNAGWEGLFVRACELAFVTGHGRRVRVLAAVGDRHHNRPSEVHLAGIICLHMLGYAALLVHTYAGCQQHVGHVVGVTAEFRAGFNLVHTAARCQGYFGGGVVLRGLEWSATFHGC